jgi:hypothetical protein
MIKYIVIYENTIMDEIVIYENNKISRWVSTQFIYNTIAIACSLYTKISIYNETTYKTTEQNYSPVSYISNNSHFKFVE